MVCGRFQVQVLRRSRKRTKRERKTERKKERKEGVTKCGTLRFSVTCLSDKKFNNMLVLHNIEQHILNSKFKQNVNSGILVNRSADTGNGSHLASNYLLPCYLLMN